MLTTEKSPFITLNEVSTICGPCWVEENHIEEIDINIVGHFNNCVSLELLCDCVRPIPLYNSTHNIGYIIRTFIGLLEASNEDGLYLQKLKGRKIRIAYEGEHKFMGKSIALGHPYKDKWIIITDLMKAGME